jgi:hypothetical protein
MVDKEPLMTDEEIVGYLEKMFFKTQEIYAIMKKGEFIPAHEKLGGILKNIVNLRQQVQKRVKPPE